MMALARRALPASLRIRCPVPVKFAIPLWGARHLFSAAQVAERNAFLRNVYSRYWAADAEGNFAEKQRLSESGELFANHFKLFRSRSEYHEELLSDPVYAKKLPRIRE